MRRLEGGTDRKEWAGDMALLLRWDGAGLIPGLDLGAVPAGRFSQTCTRAASGLRLGSLGTPARSWLTTGGSVS